MRIVCISDTHGQQDRLVIPEGDLLLHAGDLSKRGTREELAPFFDWFEAQPHPHKVLIAGNHDFLAEKDREAFRAMIPDSCTYLEDESVEIGGLHIYGSPITPWFFDWAFNRQRGEEIKTYWDKIPANTDILITHGPPHHMLDLTFRNVYAGCEELGKAVARIRPRLHLFGHIHEAYGQLSQNGTLYVNASVVDLSYQVVNPPVVIDWP